MLGWDLTAALWIGVSTEPKDQSVPSGVNELTVIGTLESPNQSHKRIKKARNKLTLSTEP